MVQRFARKAKSRPCEKISARHNRACDRACWRRLERQNSRVVSGGTFLSAIHLTHAEYGKTRGVQNETRFSCIGPLIFRDGVVAGELVPGRWIHRDSQSAGPDCAGAFCLRAARSDVSPRARWTLIMIRSPPRRWWSRSFTIPTARFWRGRICFLFPKVRTSTNSRWTSMAR